MTQQNKIYEISDLIDKLCDNNISEAELNYITYNAGPEDLAIITSRIFDNNKDDLLKKSAVTGTLDKLNDIKNTVRNKKYFKKINQSFNSIKINPRNGKKNRVIVAEGDSWFNYPIILKDIIDWISLEPNFAVYSLAAGGDWFYNMLSSRDYVNGLSVHHPDIFLISGGGNDIVGLYRVATIVDHDTKKNDELGFNKNPWANRIIVDSTSNLPKEFYDGVKYLSKDFFALLMLFRIQYFTLIKPLVIDASLKFPELKVIIQGYDFPIPSISSGYGKNILNWYIPLLRNLGHGHWIKTPLFIRNIPEKHHRQVALAMIYLYNEMQIDVANLLNKLAMEKRNISWNPVHHIDFRGNVEFGWADELHPTQKSFYHLAKKMINKINELT